MDSSPLSDPGTWPFTSPSAPGESIPTWLYRRALFLLDRDWRDAFVSHYHIRDVLMTQTGLYIPDALMTAITAQFASFGEHVMLQIRAFPGADMCPPPGCQVQPMLPVREQTTTTARFQEFQEQAEAHRALERLEQEKEVSQSEKGESAAGDEEKNPVPIADETSRHSPRTLEAATILLSLRDEVLFPVPTNLHTNQEAEGSNPGNNLRSRHPHPGSQQQPLTEELRRERILQKRLGLMVEAVRFNEGIGPTDSDSTGEAAGRDVNYIADPADYRLFRGASGQERRVIRHEPPSLPPSPSRSPRYTYESQPELDPDLHYWTSADGSKQDMKKFKPDPNPAPPPKRKWEDVIAATEKAQEDAQRGSMAKAPAKGKKGKGAANQKAKADKSASENKRSPAVKRTGTTPSRRPAARAPASAGTLTRNTRSAAKRKREEEEEVQRQQQKAASSTESSSEDGAESDSATSSATDGESDSPSAPPAKKIRLRLIFKMPEVSDGSL